MTKAQALDIIIAYMKTHDLIDEFLHEIECQRAYNSVITNTVFGSTLIWYKTAQGGSFWHFHNNELSRELTHDVYFSLASLRLRCSDIIDQLKLQHAPQTYEFW